VWTFTVSALGGFDGVKPPYEASRAGANETRVTIT
jgi:hypothetical protein